MRLNLTLGGSDVGQVNLALFTACEVEIHRTSDEYPKSSAPTVEPRTSDLKKENAAPFAEDHDVKTTDEVSRLHPKYNLCFVARHLIIALHFGEIGA